MIDSIPSNTDSQSLLLALAAKRDEINTQIATLKAEITRLTSGIVHIDATIGLLSGINNVKPVKTTYNRIFKPNECKTAVLDVLRRSGSKMDTKSIALLVANAKGIDALSPNFNSFQNAVVGCLRTLEKRKLVRAVGKDGVMLIWEII